MKIGPGDCADNCVCRCIGVEVTITPKSEEEIKAEILRIFEGASEKIPYTDEGRAQFTEMLSNAGFSNVEVTIYPCESNEQQQIRYGHVALVDKPPHPAMRLHTEDDPT